MNDVAADEQQLAADIVAMVGGRAEAGVTVSRDRHGLTRFANSFIHQHVAEDTTTVALTLAVDGGRVATATTAATDSDSLRRFVDATLEAARLQPVDPHWPGPAPPQDVGPGNHVDETTAAAQPEQRAEMVREFVDADRDLSAAGYVDTAHAEVAFLNTAGQTASGAVTRATVDGIHQTGTSAGSAHQTARGIDRLDAAAAGALAADRARRSEEFVEVPADTYEVVLGPECVATIASFFGLYGFNGKAVLDGGSFVEQGAAQFDDQFTLVADAHDARSVALPFDSEGTPSQRVTLVDRGVTSGLVLDRRTAARMGTQSTGHAMPGGYGAFPSTSVVAAGDTPAELLIAGVERGLLLTQLHYCRILDPKTQVVTGLTRNGTFLIEDGRLVGAVGNLRFTQSFLEALAPGHIRGIGDDARYADSEFGPGLVIAPSMRLAEWTFTGGAAG